MADLTPTSLAAAARISFPYASQILSGARSPARGLALTIFSATGRKFGPLAALSDEDVSTLVRIEGPARPQEQEAA